MTNALDKSETITARCAVLGLSPARARRLAEVDGNDITHVLGLDMITLTPLKPKRWLWMAAKTSSVSYRRELSSDELQHALVTGEAPPAMVSTLLHFLDEAPVLLVVMAVEEAAQRESVTPAQIWSNIEKLAKKLSANRHELWA